MTPAETEIARALAGHAEWRWMPGMRAMPYGFGADEDCRQLGADRVRVVDEWEAGGAFGAPAWWLPDLTDAATVGCLLAMVWEAQSRGAIGVSYDPFAGSWLVRLGPPPAIIRPGPGPDTHGPTLAVAVARAWLATRGGGA